jgi:nitrogen fixation NifU-like protein
MGVAVMEFKGWESIAKEVDEAVLRELGEGLTLAFVDHTLRPRNLGDMENPDGEAVLTGICEDTVRVQIRLVSDRIQEVRFMTNGCGATVACASMASELAKGKTVQEAMRIDGKRVIRAFGGLPIEHTHCADLAANALRAALRDAVDKTKEPWKRLYRSRGV